MGYDGHGTIVTISGFSAKLISVDGPDLKRESIDDTDMSTEDAMEFIPASLYDGGEVTLGVVHYITALPPIQGSKGTVTINWANKGSVWSFDAFITNYKGGAQIGSRMEGSVTLKVSGKVTVS